RDCASWVMPEPQSELQHVEGGFHAAPFAKFVAPGGTELRPAQTFRIVRRERIGDRAVSPFQPAPRRLPLRPFPARVNAEHSGNALDHHLAHIGERLADERDLTRVFSEAFAA